MCRYDVRLFRQHHRSSSFDLVCVQEFAAVFYQEGKKTTDPAQLAQNVWDMFDPKNTGGITLEGVESVRMSGNSSLLIISWHWAELKVCDSLCTTGF